MKPKTIFIIFTIFIFQYSLLNSQDTWVQTYRPFQRQYWTDSYTVEDVIVTQDGGYVVSGSYELIGEMPSDYERWGFLMKTDCDGNLLWAVSDSVDFMPDNGDFVDFVETSDGDLITIGYSFTGGYIIKRNLDGTRQWDNEYIDFGVNSMCKTLDGNIALGGRIYADSALRKMDNNGNTIWTKSYEIGTGSNVYSVFQASDGGYLLTGINYNNNDILVIKTDTNGDSLWTRTFDGLGGNDRGNCIIETSDGNILVCGWLYNDGYNGFIWKINSSGETLWYQIYDDGTVYYILSIVQSFDENYVLQGGKLIKIDEEQNIIWNEPLSGQSFGNGDKNLQQTSTGGYLCVATENYHDHIVLNKTDSLGQVTAIDNNELMIINSQLVCYPNPVNNATTISFSTFNLGKTELNLYNIKGQCIKTFFDESISTGNHKIIWNGTDKSGKSVSSGTYFIKLQNGNSVTCKKIILIK